MQGIDRILHDLLSVAKAAKKENKAAIEAVAPPILEEIKKPGAQSLKILNKRIGLPYLKKKSLEMSTCMRSVAGDRKTFPVEELPSSSCKMFIQILIAD